MPIYKVGNIKKDGLQKYHVRINYVADNGKKKQITRSVYGIDVAKDLERRLENEIKVQHEMPTKKMTVKQLYDEYIAVKKYEVREITLYRSDNMIKRYILPILEDVRIDKLTTQVLQDWKLYTKTSIIKSTEILKTHWLPKQKLIFIRQKNLKSTLKQQKNKHYKNS